MGKLHQIVDWILIADLDKKYNFSLHIACAELQTDITIYSYAAKKVILIELTCLVRRMWRSGMTMRSINTYH